MRARLEAELRQSGRTRYESDFGRAAIVEPLEQRVDLVAALNAASEQDVAAIIAACTPPSAETLRGMVRSGLVSASVQTAIVDARSASRLRLWRPTIAHEATRSGRWTAALLRIEQLVRAGRKQVAVEEVLDLLKGSERATTSRGGDRNRQRAEPVGDESD